MAFSLPYISMESTIFFSLLAFIIFFLTKKRVSYRNVPPGSLRIPMIGQSLELLKAMRADRTEEWLQQRAQKYGPISKLSLFGTPTVFLTGQAHNKFIYTCDEHTLPTKQPPSIRSLLGATNLFEMTNQDHNRLGGAFLSFLKPEALKHYVGKIDQEIRLHLTQRWHHRSLRVRAEAGAIVRELIREKREKLESRGATCRACATRPAPRFSPS